MHSARRRVGHGYRRAQAFTTDPAIPAENPSDAYIGSGVPRLRREAGESRLRTSGALIYGDQDKESEATVLPVVASTAMGKLSHHREPLRGACNDLTDVAVALTPGRTRTSARSIIPIFSVICLER